MLRQRKQDEAPNIQLALIICAQGAVREKLVSSALKCGLSPICCSNLVEARTLLPQDNFTVVMCSEGLRDGDFRAVVREVRKSNAHTPVVVFGQSHDWDSYLKALGAGAYDYIVCPPNPAEVERVMWQVLADTIGARKASPPAL